MGARLVLDAATALPCVLPYRAEEGTAGRRRELCHQHWQRERWGDWVNALHGLKHRVHPSKFPLHVRIILDLGIGVGHHRDEQVDEQHIGHEHVHPEHRRAVSGRPLKHLIRVKFAVHRPRGDLQDVVYVVCFGGDGDEGDSKSQHEDGRERDPKGHVLEHLHDHNDQHTDRFERGVVLQQPAPNEQIVDRQQRMLHGVIVDGVPGGREVDHAAGEGCTGDGKDDVVVLVPQVHLEGVWLHDILVHLVENEPRGPTAEQGFHRADLSFRHVVLDHHHVRVDQHVK
mmetsp:Transcript_22213/g.65651  ORF Transcript_22213/g.65651 Transcript_22213/m.65651 type:complete len:285 (-) Transcript_22213:527-1381(-)